MRQSLFAAAAFAVLLPAAMLPAMATAQPLVQSQEGIALQNEIDQLQSQVQQLQSSGGNNGGSALGGSSPPPAPSDNSGGGAPNGGIVASLLTQVQTLQQQVQTLNGEVDTLQNQVTTQNAQTQKEIGDLNFKLTGSATPGMPPAPGTAPSAPATPGQLQPPTPQAAAPSEPAAPADTSSADPKVQLHTAIAAYDSRDYATAASLATSLVNSHKQAPEAYRAQYLVAQSEAAEGQSQSAAIAYDDTYNMNRTGPYAPQSLLGLANSLADINQNEAACDTLSSLNSQFPTPPAGLAPRIAAVSKKAGCQ